VSARILVTGASGFVGRPLVKALRDGGSPVRAAVRDPDRSGLAGEVEVVRVCDFSQPVDWAPMLEGVERVVHLAGIAHVGPGVASDAYDRVNHRATADLAAACTQAGVRRLVFVSSVRAQSGSEADHILRETDVPAPTEPYGRSKLAGEEAVRAGATEWTILRPVVIYGPGAKGNLAQLERIADTPLPLPLAGLTNRRSLLGMGNLIAAIKHVLIEAQCARRTFLVADPEPVTLADMVMALRNGLGRPPRVFALPSALIAVPLKLIGRQAVWDRLGGALVADASELIATGWRPDPDTRAAIACMAQAEKRHR
jgi:nucleoside-diphosphate-sugar epimerase